MGAGGVDIQKTTARLSASLARYEPKMSDVYFKSNPLFEHLNKMSETQNGGLEMAIRFEYGRVPALGSTGGSKAFQYLDRLNLALLDAVKTGTEPFKNIATPISISWEEQRENIEPNGFKLLKQKVDNAGKSIRDDMGLVVWGLAGGDQSLLPAPIPKLISGSGLGSGYTVHGLAKSSNMWMYSQEEAAIGEFADNGLTAMRSLVNSCRINAPDQNDKPTMGFTDQDVHEAYEDLLPDHFQTQSTDKGDLGFEELFFKKIPIRIDRNIGTDPSGLKQIFFINNKYLKLKYDSEGKFKTFDMVWMAPEYLGWATQIVFRGGVICTNFQAQGVGYGITVIT